MEGNCERALLSLTATSDPVLAEVWDNEKDAAYHKLGSMPPPDMEAVDEKLRLILRLPR